MDVRIVKPACAGSVNAVPSKSMALRWLIAAALSGLGIADRTAGLSRDIDAARNCIEDLMVFANGEASDRTAELHPGESGSALRFLVPIAAALGVNSDFVCEGRLADRPMEVMSVLLREHGCSMSDAGSNPVEIRGKLEPGEYRLPGNVSSQYVSGLLMALPLLEGDSSIQLEGVLQSRPYVDLTLEVLRASGIEIEETAVSSGARFVIKGSQSYKLAEFPEIEADWSNAAFWIVLNELVGGGVECRGLSEESVQGDKQITSIVRLADSDEDIIRIDACDIPDLVPVLCVWGASLAEGRTLIIDNIERLRYKESDRVESSLALVQSLGGIIEANEKTISVQGTAMLRGGEIDSFNDHRIVMSAAVAAAICEVPVVISGAQAVAKSYPRFFEDYGTLGGVIEIIGE